MSSHDGYIGFGSNLGDPWSQIRQALRALSEQSVGLERVSSLYRTEPVDSPVQPWFLNGVARVKTPFEPGELLKVCQIIESRQGRTRDIHYGPRTIDLDLLLADGTVIETPDLTLPHPRLHLRRFVLVPLSEIAPDLVHPKLGSTVTALLAKCPDRSTVIRVGSMDLT